MNVDVGADHDLKDRMFQDAIQEVEKVEMSPTSTKAKEYMEFECYYGNSTAGCLALTHLN